LRPKFQTVGFLKIPETLPNDTAEHPTRPEYPEEKLADLKGKLTLWKRKMLLVRNYNCSWEAKILNFLK
jgi:hypothetical protein